MKRSVLRPQPVVEHEQPRHCSHIRMYGTRSDGLRRNMFEELKDRILRTRTKVFRWPPQYVEALNRGIAWWKNTDGSFGRWKRDGSRSGHQLPQSDSARQKKRCKPLHLGMSSNRVESVIVDGKVDGESTFAHLVWMNLPRSGESRQAGMEKVDTIALQGEEYIPKVGTTMNSMKRSKLERKNSAPTPPVSKCETRATAPKRKMWPD